MKNIVKMYIAVKEPVKLIPCLITTKFEKFSIDVTVCFRERFSQVSHITQHSTSITATSHNINYHQRVVEKLLGKCWIKHIQISLYVSIRVSVTCTRSHNIRELLKNC